jgi:hypothetical protein
MSKTGKNHKNPWYIRYIKKSVIFEKSKPILNRLGVFRAVRDLEVHKRMRSSDATCCASMAVNTCFFSTWAITSKIWPPGALKLSALGRHPDWHSFLARAYKISSSKMSKTGKNSKIRYKSVIFEKSKIDFKLTGCVPVSLQPLATITHAYFQSYMLCTTRNQYFTS